MPTQHPLLIVRLGDYDYNPEFKFLRCVGIFAY